MSRPVRHVRVRSRARASPAFLPAPRRAALAGRCREPVWPQRGTGWSSGLLYEELAEPCPRRPRGAFVTLIRRLGCPQSLCVVNLGETRVFWGQARLPRSPLSVRLWTEEGQTGRSAGFRGADAVRGALSQPVGLCSGTCCGEPGWHRVEDEGGRGRLESDIGCCLLWVF